MKKGEAASFVSRDLSPCFSSLPSPVSCLSFPSSGSSPLVPSLLSSCCDSDVTRIFPPWDLLRGRDVFRDSEILEQELDDSLVHWAPNCATFSRAREIPIKNVPNPPRPLRSLEYPEGIPSETRLLSKKSLKRLRDDTRMADMAAVNCLHRHRQAKKFSLEHPGRSLALELPSWKKLRSSSGVREIFYHTCCFRGSRRKKYQILISNSDEFVERIGKTCDGSHTCLRTGEKHLKWRPTVSSGRVTQFKTGDEREYPQGFCELYAEAAELILGTHGRFCEVFSGPNAPLSQEVARKIGSRVPGRRLDISNQKGVRNELQHLADLIKVSEPDPSWETWSPKEISRARAVTVQSGRQPGYGKRIQLIPDGTNDPLRHLKMSLGLTHPFEAELVLKEDHRLSLEDMDVFSEEEVKTRLKVLGEWKCLAGSSEVSSLQGRHESLACRAAVKLGRRPRTALMEKLNQRYAIEDRAVPMLCLKGLPIVGEALESPFFDDYVVPASISIKELLSTAPTRRQATIKRIKVMAESGSSQLALAIWKKTLKEVDQGSMAGPFSMQEIENKHGRFYNVVPSFGLEQGSDEHGFPKYRRIDDHSASHNNHAAGRKQKIEMAGVDYLMVMIAALAKKNHTDLTIATEDMKQAYRQVPLPDA